MPELFFISHADVLIDPDVPVPDWGLSERGRARHQAHVDSGALDDVGAVFCSAEQKARDGAGIIATKLGLSAQIHEPLHENDRSATGYLAREEFEATADAFFAHPDQSIRGWERARDAQTRIIGAVQHCTVDARRDVAIVAHGAVGALFLCHLKGVEISREFDQPGQGGGNMIRARMPELTLIEGWRDIAPGVA